jgi:hypothetical protein
VNEPSNGLAWLILLAQEDQIEDLRRGFTEEVASRELQALVLAVAGSFALVLLLRRCLRRSREPRRVVRPDYLAQAADLLGLSADERRLVQRLAARARLAEPVALLLSPRNLAHALSGGSGQHADPQLYAQVDALCQRVFHEPLPPPPDESPQVA